MKFIVKIIFIAFFSYIAGLYLPFWSLALVAFVGSIIIRTSPASSFFAGFLAVFLLWSVLAFAIDQQTESLLTERVAQVFMGISNIVLIVITGVIGGLVGGLGAASGASLMNLAGKKKHKYYS